MPFFTTPANDSYSPPVRLHYDVFGQPCAKDKILFIQGLNCSSELWREQVLSFAPSQHYQICLIDNRGMAKLT
jgi:pimeloyl-ACP methyl ester carboxylesterase